MSRVLGIGGIFVKCADTEAVKAWYTRVLRLQLQDDFSGAMFPPLSQGFTLWSPFKASTDYMDPGTQPYMVNFIVEDMDSMLAHVRAKGETILGTQDESYGRFAWLLDPNGCKIELWQPLGEPPPQP